MYVFVTNPLPWHHLVVPAQARQERQMFQKAGGEGRLYKVSKIERKQGQEVEGDHNDDPQNYRQLTNKNK